MLRKSLPLEILLVFALTAWLTGTPVDNPVTLPALEKTAPHSVQENAKNLYLLAYGYSLENPQRAKMYLNEFFIHSSELSDLQLLARALRLRARLGF